MTNAARTTPTNRLPMDSMRKTALVAGVLYLMTFISIPRLFLYGPVLNDPNYIVSSLSDTGVLWGVILEMIVALAIVGTGVALFQSSNDTTKASRLASSPLASLKPPLSSSAASAFFRS